VLEEAGEMARVRIVDFHGEATSEKIAMAWYLDGRVSAVVGTHTHVPTADPRILEGGTAAITDIGMVGPYNSIIGMDPRVAIDGFVTALPQKFTVGPGPRIQFNSVLLDVDEQTGQARSIERLDRLGLEKAQADFAISRAAQAVVYLEGTLSEAHQERWAACKQQALSFLWDDRDDLIPRA